MPSGTSHSRTATDCSWMVVVMAVIGVSIPSPSLRQWFTSRRTAGFLGQM